jgi:hypothetical protein
MAIAWTSKSISSIVIIEIGLGLKPAIFITVGITVSAVEVVVTSVIWKQNGNDYNGHQSSL